MRISPTDSPEDRPSHTPGPWQSDTDGMAIWAYNVPKGPMKVADVRGWGYLTGHGHGALALPHDEAIVIQKANAALIAQAPAMAERVKVLEEALDKLKLWNEGIAAGRGNHYPHDHLQVINAALASEER